MDQQLYMGSRQMQLERADTARALTRQQHFSARMVITGTVKVT